MTHEEVITIFIENHYPALKDIFIEELKLYATDDIVFHRPDDNMKLVDEEDMDSEADGIQIKFTSVERISIKDLTNFCNILCYGIAWCVLPDYGNTDISEFKDYLNGELDTCWHHTQITKLTDSRKHFYQIEQGFCTCS